MSRTIDHTSRMRGNVYTIEALRQENLEEFLEFLKVFHRGSFDVEDGYGVGIVEQGDYAYEATLRNSVTGRLSTVKYVWREEESGLDGSCVFGVIVSVSETELSVWDGIESSAGKKPDACFWETCFKELVDYLRARGDIEESHRHYGSYASRMAHQERQEALDCAYAYAKGLASSCLDLPELSRGE